MITKEEHNKELFLRPRFSIGTDQEKDIVLNTLLENIKKSKTDYKIRISENHVFIDIPEKDSHYWSPQLHFKVVKENDQTKIKGLFGPKPKVWTLFIFIHFAVAITFIGFAILFYVHHKFGGNIIFPVVMLVALPIIWFLLYFAGQIGKETGKKQMDELKHYMRILLENII